MIVRPVSKIGFALLVYFRFFNQPQCWGRHSYEYPYCAKPRTL